jgi:hypothetical protein
MAFYELVNLSSGNRVGDYATEREALCEAWAAVQRRGPGALATIGLGYQDDQGTGRLIAEGDALVRLAAQADCGSRPVG